MIEFNLLRNYQFSKKMKLDVYVGSDNIVSHYSRYSVEEIWMVCRLWKKKKRKKKKKKKKHFARRDCSPGLVVMMNPLFPLIVYPAS